MNIADFDIREYLRYIHIPFWEEGTNVGHGWIGIQCIYCDDNHNHLGIHIALKNFSCWKCKEGGSILVLMQDLEGIGYGAASQRIDEFQSLYPIEVGEAARLEAGADVLPYGCGALLRGPRRYLAGRRFDPDALVRDWGIQSGPMSGRWRYRMIIPVFLEGRVMTFVGMDTSGKRSPKYKMASVSESFLPVGELLYGFDHVNGNVVVVEGITDAWRIGPGAVAMLGMGFTVKKMHQLLALEASKYFIMMDGGEKKAMQNADKMAHALSSRGKDVEILELESGDPDDMSNDEALSLRKELKL